MRYGFGIDIGGTTVKLALFEQDGSRVEKWEIPTNTADGGKAILPDIADTVKEHLSKHCIDPSQVIGIGVGVPGAVDGRGLVNRCVNLGWGIFNISEELSALTGFPVKAGNDANVAALGEYWKGSGAGCENMVLATLGTGVGGGIIVDGHVLQGAHGSAGEIGHITINREETEPCTCGNYGCVEQYCSATGVVRLAKKRLQQPGDSCLRSIEDLTCKDIFDAGKAQDPVALEILDQFFAYLGEFVADVCNIINPGAFVFGGGVSKAGHILIDGMMPYFRKHIFHAAKNVTFSLASLGNDAGTYGAFKLALDAFA